MAKTDRTVQLQALNADTTGFILSARRRCILLNDLSRCAYVAGRYGQTFGLVYRLRAIPGLGSRVVVLCESAARQCFLACAKCNIV